MNALWQADALAIAIDDGCCFHSAELIGPAVENQARDEVYAFLAQFSSLKSGGR
jgi:hypothetical protein